MSMPTEAQQLEAMMPLIRHVARRHHGDEPDDLVQVAALGALKAIRSYDPGKGRTLASWVAARADWEIRHHIRGGLVRVARTDHEHGVRVTVISLNERLPGGPDGGTLGERIDLLADPSDPLADLHAVDAIRRLPRREAVAVLAGQLGYPQTEIGPILGVSQVHASRIQQAGHRTLREAA